mmetsp:Transcript_30936/g.89049  ORF Transcript_30936/g.89049 Transcript_30936/m.89049 type:complete len:361 (-) Transcript_30936:482-1564(-)
MPCDDLADAKADLAASIAVMACCPCGPCAAGISETIAIAWVKIFAAMATSFFRPISCTRSLAAPPASCAAASWIKEAVRLILARSSAIWLPASACASASAPSSLAAAATTRRETCAWRRSCLHHARWLWPRRFVEERTSSRRCCTLGTWLRKLAAACVSSGAATSCAEGASSLEGAAWTALLPKMDISSRSEVLSSSEPSTSTSSEEDASASPATPPPRRCSCTKLMGASPSSSSSPLLFASGTGSAAFGCACAALGCVVENTCKAFSTSSIELFCCTLSSAMAWALSAVDEQACRRAMRKPSALDALPRWSSSRRLASTERACNCAKAGSITRSSPWSDSKVCLLFSAMAGVRCGFFWI